MIAGIPFFSTQRLVCFTTRDHGRQLTISRLELHRLLFESMTSSILGARQHNLTPRKRPSWMVAVWVHIRHKMVQRCATSVSVSVPVSRRPNMQQNSIGIYSLCGVTNRKPCRSLHTLCSQTPFARHPNTSASPSSLSSRMQAKTRRRRFGRGRRWRRRRRRTTMLFWLASGSVWCCCCTFCLRWSLLAPTVRACVYVIGSRVKKKNVDGTNAL